MAAMGQKLDQLLSAFLSASHIDRG